jgi:hypothetical protein
VIAGLAAGVGGAAAGDWVDGKFFYHHPAQTFYTQIHEFGAFNPAHLQRQLPVQHGATGSW